MGLRGDGDLVLGEWVIFFWDRGLGFDWVSLRGSGARIANFWG